MSQPWIPEFEVDEQLAAKLLASQFPELLPLRLEFVGEGWDNLALLVNGAWVFRFPRRELAIQCMQAEVASLPHLPSELVLEVPRLHFIGRPAGEYRARFAGYRHLQGRSACALELSEAQRASSATRLGEFLRQLHRTPLAGQALEDVPPDRMRRTDLAYRRAQCEERLAELRELGEELCFDALRDELARLASTPSYAGEARLVHGDLYPRHLLVNDAGEVTGVIDWGDVHRGDPALDLSIAWTYLPASARAEFEVAYGRIDSATRERALFRGMLYGIVLLTYGRDVGEQPLIALGRRILIEQGERLRG